ncbi:BPSL1445 family SYLF domain-containing lipoprotein [Pseudogulbenkiania subflava]|uniref:Lipid-binding SYLF domain-containing protein n=1 Tax=Pseudogulbenkiania subflava DSM 22618 TaxID=1123014 RepID=A0A1Y6CBL5_9NEIS|nr:YSC84-related protein [Pseudogulbenkiania subflava]SMF53278.1 Lipid-binding SYLF domain-containing protein [Pseudogulbenkiania subflava DSM 22618]
MRTRKLCIGLVAALSVLASGCTTTTSKMSESPSTRSMSAASQAREIDAGYDATLARLYSNAPSSRALVAKAHGVLIFPSVIAAGLVVGGEYGKGALRVGGKPSGYYQTASASFGWQIGAQSKAIIFLFMTQDALNKFLAGSGWTVGADASVALLKMGANGDIDLNTAQQPVVGFALTNNGLMANLTFEGTKVSKLNL